MVDLISTDTARSLLKILHYAYPMVLLATFLFAFTLRSILLSSASTPTPNAKAPPRALGPGGKSLPLKSPTPNKDKIKTVALDFSKPRKLLFDWFSVLVTATFVANAINVIAHALAKRDENWWCGKAVVFYVVGSFFVYSLVLISLIDTTPSPTTAHLATWITAIIMELILLGASLALYTHPHREPRVEAVSSGQHDTKGRLRSHITTWESIDVLINLIRIFTLASQALFYLIFVISRNAHMRKNKAKTSDGSASETTGLLCEPQMQETEAREEQHTDVEAQQDQAQADDSETRRTGAEGETGEPESTDTLTAEAQDAEGQEGGTPNRDGQETAAEEEANLPLTETEADTIGAEETTKSTKSASSGSENTVGANGTVQERVQPRDSTELTDNERQPLLANGGGNAAPNEPHSINGAADKQGSKGYGTITQAPQTTTDGSQDAKTTKPAPKRDEPSGWERPNQIQSRDWWEYLKGYSVLFPYLWPSKDRKLQVLVVICFLIMVAQRALNILVPNQVGVITDILAQGDGQRTMPWGPICLYIFYRILQGGNGLLNAARSILWLPVSQYSFREISVAAFEHVHSLSLDFHLGKKTGEVVSALGKGASINSFLENVTFQVIPMIVDLVVAIWYFLVVFDSYYALTIAIVTFWYIYITIRMAQWRNDIRRAMTNADREEEAVKNDSMMSYETVKYFNAETWENQRYLNAVNKYLRAEYAVNLSLNYMNVCQNFIFMLGLLTMCFILAYQITTGQQKVGKFTTLLVYISQLQQPLNFFGTFYRVIQSAMINSERMLELFKEKPDVTDHWSAVPLPSCEGRIDFNDVKFAYDPRKQALDGVTFSVTPGTTVALVGESGGGKSTVFRLLYRFYNQQAGRIQVDGNDVHDVTIESLRKQIGVVPQDTVLFNETIMYNLRYANQDATDDEVHAACRAASIHERITEFPDGYDTKVGERGLRLSGGEKQRVAIARTILKNPRIIFLDEATAALDTETEEHIQTALTQLGLGRTMLVIAHRLSTITLADQIIVLHKGKVAETGTHDELLERRGRYAGMWEKQVKAQKAAEEAKKAKDRAEQLRKEMVMENSASQSEDEAGGAGEGGLASGAVGGEEGEGHRGHP